MGIMFSGARIWNIGRKIFLRFDIMAEKIRKKPAGSSSGSDASRRSDTEKEIRRITVAGMAVNLGLVGAKLTGGWVFRSQALLADAVHSLSDLVTDAAVLFGVRYWSAPPDRSHPYGHGRIETLVSAFIGVALASVAGGLIWQAVESLRGGTGDVPELPAFVIALLAVALKEWIFVLTRRHARRTGSSALAANAWHHHSDALSSIPAAAAIAVSHFFPQLRFIDPVGALLVSLFILHAAWKITLPTLRELADTGLSERETAELYRIVASVPGILGTHALRTRKVGSSMLVDLHILVDADMSVREGHRLSHAVREKLENSGMRITDVVVHLEPFKDRNS